MMSPRSQSQSPDPELLDLLRRTFADAVAGAADASPSRETVDRLRYEAARLGLHSAAQLLPVIRAAWASLPEAESLPRPTRDALQHRVTAALIGAHYEGR